MRPWVINQKMFKWWNVYWCSGWYYSHHRKIIRAVTASQFYLRGGAGSVSLGQRAIFHRYREPTRKICHWKEGKHNGPSLNSYPQRSLRRSLVGSKMKLPHLFPKPLEILELLETPLSQAPISATFACVVMIPPHSKIRWNCVNGDYISTEILCLDCR